MTRTEIQEILQGPRPSGLDGILFLQLGRQFAVLQALDAQVLQNAQGTDELRNLRAKNHALTEHIAEINQTLSMLPGTPSPQFLEAQEDLQKLQGELLPLQENLQKIKAECTVLQTTLDGLQNLPAQIAFLKHKKNLLEARNTDLANRITELDGEAIKKRQQVETFSPMVEEIEAIEKRLEAILEAIWAPLRTDAIDQMFTRTTRTK